MSNEQKIHNQNSVGHYPKLYVKYLIEKKSKSLAIDGNSLKVCRTGEVFLNEKLLSRSWDGEKKDYVIFIPTKNGLSNPVHFKKLFSNAFSKNN